MEKSTDLNFFALYFDNEQTKTLEKDLLYRQLVAFLQLKPLSDMILRLKQGKPNEKDFEIRDFLHSRLLPEERETPSFFHYAKSHYKEMKSINPTKVYERTFYECMTLKKEFWQKYSKFRGEESAEIRSRDIIKNTIRTYTIPYQVIFVGIAAIMSYRMRLYMNRNLYTFILMATSIWLGGNLSRFKNSSFIFNDIPPLPDKKIELERQKIVNFCFLYDTDMVSKLILKSDAKKVIKKKTN